MLRGGRDVRRTQDPPEPDRRSLSADLQLDAVHQRVHQLQPEAAAGARSPVLVPATVVANRDLGHPDTPGKLAAFAYAFEHLEIGGYEQLKRVAERAGDTETAATADTILTEERAAAKKIAGSFDEAAKVALEEQGVES